MQLRSAVVQLAQQIPATARLRLVLFAADSDSTPELDNVDGVAVVPPIGHATSHVVARIRDEIAQRTSSPGKVWPPLVIAVDDIDRFTDRHGMLSDRRRRAGAVHTLLKDLEGHRGEMLSGVHLLLTSPRLSDFHTFTWSESRHDPYTTIILPLETCDAAAHAQLMTALRYCGALNESDTDADGTARRLAYRVAGARAIRFALTPGSSSSAEPAPPQENLDPVGGSDVHGHPVTRDGAMAAAAACGWRIAEDAFGCADRCVLVSDVTQSCVELRWTWRPTSIRRRLIDYACVGSTTEVLHRFMVSGDALTAEEQMAWLLGVFTSLGYPWDQVQDNVAGEQGSGETPPSARRRLRVRWHVGVRK